jgi:hypothetical protein
MSESGLCPVCYAKHGHSVRKITAQEAAQHFALKERNLEQHLAVKNEIETVWGGPSCLVVRCDNCGFCYSEPYVAGSQRFYELTYGNPNYPHWRWEYSRTLDVIAQRSDFNLLEIGAGSGIFSRELCSRWTPASKIVCTEYSAAGAEEIRKSGMICYQADVRSIELDAYRQKFDVICLFQVLEHLDALDALFERFTFLGSANAELFISVPNQRRIEFNEKNGCCIDMPPGHIGRWSRTCFELIGRRHGWELMGHELERTEGMFSRWSTIAYHQFLRRSHDPKSLANLAARVKANRLRKAITVAVICLYGLRSLSTFLRAMSAELGGSQWVWMRRKGN